MFKTLIAAALISISSLAIAQSTTNNCFPTKTVVETLVKNFGETIHYGGRSGQLAVTIWFNKEKKTMTVVMSNAEGKSCIMIEAINVEEMPKGKLL